MDPLEVGDPLEKGDPWSIGQYRLLRRLGKGGMGRVYLGESPGGRLVAVKITHPHLAEDPEFRRRFADEVEAARRIGGFISAQVVEAEPGAELPWMATAYIPGPSLAKAIKEGKPLSGAEVRRLGAALAEGLTVIHRHGYIHRDLKPGNVILADDGPRIIDFGIVRITDATSMTMPGMVIGTPEYMAPEQLQAGDGQELTPQCDIFALGGVLTYAATGHAPFHGTTTELYYQIVTGPPNLDSLGGDLRKIIADCLEKNPRDRPSAAELLGRFNSAAAAAGSATNGTGGPVTQTPPEEHTLRVRRGPAQPPAVGKPVTSGGAGTVAEAPLPALIFPGTGSGARPDGVLAAPVGDATQSVPYVPPAPGPLKAPPRNQAPPVTGRKSQRGAVGGSNAPAALLASLGFTGATQGRGGSRRPVAGESGGNPQRPQRVVGQRRVRPLVAASVGTIVVVGLAGLVIFLLRNHTAGGSSGTVSSATGALAATLYPAGSIESSVAFGPGSTLACGDRDGSTYLWNTATVKRTVTLTDAASRRGVYSVAFGPDGLLAAGGNNGDTDLWNGTTGTHVTTLSDASHQVVPSVAFGPDGMVATSQVSSTDLWSSSTGKLIARLADPSGSAGVFSLAFGPDGTLAVGDHNGKTYLWNTTTRKITATLTDPASTGVNSVAFATNGILAVGDANGQTYLWNTTTRKVTATLIDPRGTGVESVAFAPNGILAAGDRNGATYLWNTATRNLIATLTDPASDGVWSVAFAPDKTVLATGDGNGRTYLWNVSYHAS